MITFIMGFIDYINIKVIKAIKAIKVGLKLTGILIKAIIFRMFLNIQQSQN